MLRRVEVDDDRKLTPWERRWVLALSGVSERALRHWQRQGPYRRRTREAIEKALAQVRSGQSVTINLGEPS